MASRQVPRGSVCIRNGAPLPEVLEPTNWLGIGYLLALGISTPFSLFLLGMALNRRGRPGALTLPIAVWSGGAGGGRVAGPGLPAAEHPSRRENVKLPCLCLAMLAAIASSVACAPAAPPGPRVAVWDPVKGTREPPNRFRVDLEHLEQVAGWLREADIPTERVTTEQIGDPAALSAARFDALMLPGDAFPRASAPALTRFSEEGGILIGLNARVPFLVAIAREPDGFWTMDPKTPSFAWQSDEILRLFGLKYVYKPVMHDQGVRHTSTALLKRYLPGAPDIARKLPGNWVPTFRTTGGEGEVYPLVRSRRADGADVTPQLYVARYGRHTAIFSASEIYTRPADPVLWPVARETVLALARLAGDLRAGRVSLAPEMRTAIAEDLAPPEPLTGRLPTGSVDPEGAVPAVRWGRFDGSSLELAPPLPAGQTRVAAPTGPGRGLPRALHPDAVVKLALPALGDGPHFLRVRGAFDANGAALAARLDDLTALSETFVYVDAGGPGNYGAADLGGAPAEFQRVVYLPPTPRPAATLVLSNPGTKPVYLDALQIERRTRPAPEMVLGVNQGISWSYPGGKNVIPREVSSQWTALRANIRTQFVGPPGDPRRWDKLDQHVAQYLAVGVPLHLLFEGTPRWAAVSEERYRNAGSRSHTVPPDPEKYAEIVEYVIGRYGDRVDVYELWNEANIGQFWPGTAAEYVAFCRRIIPIIRKLDPTARILTCGMAGFHEIFFDALDQGGVLKAVDLVAFHPYAGKSPVWDVPYGQVQGALYARGNAMEVYNNEMGFVWRAGEWFQGPYTAGVQRDLLDIALARLLANGAAKLSLFHAGGDDHHFSLVDAKGSPRPAYGVFADYLPLGRRGSRRLDVSLARADGQPLRGIYTAAASHDDGSVTVVVNPSEYEPLRPVEDPSQEMNETAGWVTFFGQSAAAEGTVTLTVEAGKANAGFYRPIRLDPARLPRLEVSVPACEGHWDLFLKPSPDREIPVAKGQGAGTFGADLRPLLGGTAPFSGELLFRVYGRTTLDYVRFLPPEGPAPPRPSLAVRLAIPLSHDRPVRGEARSGGAASPVPVALRRSGKARWAEVALDLRGRTVMTLGP